MQTPGDALTLHLFTWTSVACVVAYLLFRGQRSYLLYLGAGFMCMALIVLIDGITRGEVITRWVVIIITPLAFIMAIVEGYSDMKERVRQLREEQREREKAFAEIQLALVQRENERKESG